MKTINKERVALLVTVAAIALSSFRNQHTPDEERPLLQAINSHAGTLLITYNTQHQLSKLTRVQRTTDEMYTDVRIPVYESGHLVSTLVSGKESGESSEIFSSFDYAEDYRQISRIRYYTEGQAHGYDSLVYDKAGRITARYFFSSTRGQYENHNYQAYSWDAAGNMRQLDSYGRTAANGSFALTTSIVYTYDNKPNPQQQITGLCYMTDIQPAALSTNNVLTEQITHVATGEKSVNTYIYAYNAVGYPTRVTASFGADGAEETTELRYE
ncbi:hypothetical protein F0L74_10250 [Chitinophaga agrisoli]|uniref:YD repeat-containing protein n=1 Tax=Chitinophaga agrisoli TaxID=2607653 RepID=A0A5B2VW82_9BACT|nr:hypothetical protein [Chitinophaga agrisoli]KAA2242900.1 hypothetical protein F0L74_10250 [Chitinophaga agrisoli]